MTRKSTDKEHEDAISTMRNFMAPENPKVGIFWYDYNKEELFGVNKTEVTPEMMKQKQVTHPKLHRNYWQKWHFRAVAKHDTESIFYKEHNYTLIPRGRIFLSDGKFSVMVGDWIEKGINDKPINAEKLHDLICDEFDLPEDFDFIIDSHWNIGRGWSEKENILDENPRIYKIEKNIISEQEIEQKAIKAIILRTSDPAAKSLNAEQKEAVKLYLALFPAEETEQKAESLWIKADNNMANINKAWREDAHKEIIDLSNGIERNLSNGLKP